MIDNLMTAALEPWLPWAEGRKHVTFILSCQGKTNANGMGISQTSSTGTISLGLVVYILLKSIWHAETASKKQRVDDPWQELFERSLTSNFWSLILAEIGEKHYQSLPLRKLQV